MAYKNMTDKIMIDDTQLLEKLNNEIDSKLQFVDYAELKVNKHLAKSEQPETQHFAISTRRRAKLCNLFYVIEIVSCTA
jgi:hypothetical protein